MKLILRDQIVRNNSSLFLTSMDGGIEKLIALKGLRELISNLNITSQMEPLVYWEGRRNSNWGYS